MNHEDDDIFFCGRYCSYYLSYSSWNLGERECPRDYYCPGRDAGALSCPRGYEAGDKGASSCTMTPKLIAVTVQSTESLSA